MSEPENNIFQHLLKQGPKKDLGDFLKTFKGAVFNGKKGFGAARKYLWERKGDCVVIFHDWFVILKTGADWMNCLKLRAYMNDWR